MQIFPRDPLDRAAVRHSLIFQRQACLQKATSGRLLGQRPSSLQPLPIRFACSPARPSVSREARSCQYLDRLFIPVYPSRCGARPLVVRFQPAPQLLMGLPSVETAQLVRRRPGFVRIRRIQEDPSEDKMLLFDAGPSGQELLGRPCPQVQPYSLQGRQGREARRLQRGHYARAP